MGVRYVATEGLSALPWRPRARGRTRRRRLWVPAMRACTLGRPGAPARYYADAHPLSCAEEWHAWQPVRIAGGLGTLVRSARVARRLGEHSEAPTVWRTGRSAAEDGQEVSHANAG